MARDLVQLKLRLLVNALRSSRRARASFVASCIVALLVAAGTFLVLALLRGSAAPVTQTAAVFTVFAFGWLILPIMAFGLDGTLDPATLALYPLRTRPLATGLLAASATGAWPVANVLGLLGVLIGLARGPLGIVVAVVAVVLQVLFCITLARLLTTSLAGMLRSRRGKDFAAFLVVPLFALYELFAQVVPRLAAEGKITTQTFAGIDRWLRWLPPGLAAHAIQDASAGRPGPALLRLGLLAAVIVVLGALWIRFLGRALVTVDTSTQSSAVRGAPLPFARSGIRGTVAGRFLLYQRRDPASIVRWCIIAVVMAASSVSTIRTPAYHVGLLISSILGAAMIGLLHANSIGFTGPSFWLEAASLTGGRALRGYLAGRNIALAVIAVPLTVVMSFAVAAAAGHPADGIWAAAIDIAAVGAALGLSSIFSITLAYPGQRRVGSPVPGTADGYSGQAIACSFGTLLGVAVITLPVTGLLLATDSVPAMVRLPVLVAAAVVYGAGLAWGGTRIAAAAAAQKLPELSQIAAQSTL
jgi:ABC-2 type transport system permease protein